MHDASEPAPPDDALLGIDPEVEPDPDALHHARATLPHLALVATGGAIGVLCRDLLLRAAPASPDGYPWMLACVNVAGALALGVLVALVLDRRPGATGVRLFVATGVLGGFTTYSSLVAAAVVSGHDGHVGTGIATMLATCVAGVAGAWLGARAHRTAR